jgi:hypothetical protein
MAVERWETEVGNCEVTPQAVWPIAKLLMKGDGPKAQSAFHGPLGITPPEQERRYDCSLFLKTVHTSLPV